MFAFVVMPLKKYLRSKKEIFAVSAQKSSTDCRKYFSLAIVCVQYNTMNYSDVRQFSICFRNLFCNDGDEYDNADDDGGNDDEDDDGSDV